MNLDNDESYKMVTLQGRTSTLGNHVCFILYTMKYLHQEAVPTYINLPALVQHRSLATQLQKQGDCEQPQSREELTQPGKWLDWYVKLSFLS